MMGKCTTNEHKEHRKAIGNDKHSQNTNSIVPLRTNFGRKWFKLQEYAKNGTHKTAYTYSQKSRRNRSESQFAHPHVLIDTNVLSGC